MAFIEEVDEAYPGDYAQPVARSMRCAGYFSPPAPHPQLVCLFAVFYPRLALPLFRYISSRLLRAPLSDTELALVIMDDDQPVQPIFNSSIKFDTPFAPLPQYLRDLLSKPRGLLTGSQEDHSSRFQLLPSEPEVDLPPSPLIHHAQLDTPGNLYEHLHQPTRSPGSPWERSQYLPAPSPYGLWFGSESQEDGGDDAGVFYQAREEPNHEGRWTQDPYGSVDVSEPFDHRINNQTVHDRDGRSPHSALAHGYTLIEPHSSCGQPFSPTAAFHDHASASQEQEEPYTATDRADYASTPYRNEASFDVPLPWGMDLDDEPTDDHSSYSIDNRPELTSVHQAYDDPSAGQSSGPYNHDSSHDQQWSTQSQWRVGRLPGHQGSHVKSPKRPASDMSPSPPRRSPERVLKKPFRPPTKVILPRVAPATRDPDQPRVDEEHRSYDQTATVHHGETGSWSAKGKAPARIVLPRKTDAEPNQRRVVHEHHDRDTQLELPEPVHRIASDRVTKPFKQPGGAVRSTVRSVHRPAPYPLSSEDAGKNRSTAREIVKLEDHLRTLKSALRYLEEPEEDEKLVSLIETWRDGGRQVAEMLYQRYPKPEPEDPWSNPSRAAAGGQWGAGSISDTWSDDLTDEHRRYLANFSVNKNGDTVDKEGNLLYPDEGPDDIPSLLGSSKRTRPYNDAHESHTRPIRGDDFMTETLSATNAVDSSKWTVGSVMLKLGVAPDLLGWDNSEEDWRE